MVHADPGRVLIFIAVALGGGVACKHEFAAPPPTAADCTAAVTRLVDQQIADGLAAVAKASGSADPAALKSELDTRKAAMTDMIASAKLGIAKVCVDDKWPDDAIACMKRTHDGDAMDACQMLLSAEQGHHMDEVTREAMKPAPS